MVHSGGFLANVHPSPKTAAFPVRHHYPIYDISLNVKMFTTISILKREIYYNSTNLTCILFTL